MGSLFFNNIYINGGIYMNIIDLIAMIDLSWKENCTMLGIKPNIDKGYIHYRNEVYKKAINKCIQV